MPLDIHCPSCRSSFPVTNAGAEFHVECPACDAGIGVSVEHPDANRIGSVPQASAQLAEAPAAKAVPATSPRPRSLDDEDDDAPTRGKGSTSAWVVIIGSSIGLLLVLAGVGTTGYFLFTNLDTDDPPPPSRGSPTGGPNKTQTPNTPVPLHGGIAPRPNPIPTPPRPNVTPKTPIGFTPPLPNANPQTPLGTIVVKNAPIVPVAITPMPAGGPNPFTITLPGRVEQAVVGGGGRYLAVTFMQPPKVMVFDLCTGKVISELTHERERLVYAAGMNTFVVGHPTKQILRYYTFPELAPHGESPSLPGGEPLTGLAMGSATNGPLFVCAPREIALFDIESKSLVAGSRKPTGGQSVMFGADVRASHDGKLFATAVVNGVNFHRVEDGRWVDRQVMMVGPLHLGVTSDRVYGAGTLHELDGRPTGLRSINNRGPVSFVPAVHGTKFLQIADQSPALRGAGPGEWTRAVEIFDNADTRNPILSLGVLPELTSRESMIDRNNLFDRQLFLVPDAKVLAVIPQSRDKIVLRRVKLD